MSKPKNPLYQYFSSTRDYPNPSYRWTESNRSPSKVKPRIYPTAIPPSRNRWPNLFRAFFSVYPHIASSSGWKTWESSTKSPSSRRWPSASERYTAEIEVQPTLWINRRNCRKLNTRTGSVARVRTHGRDGKWRNPVDACVAAGPLVSGHRKRNSVGARSNSHSRSDRLEKSINVLNRDD